MFACWRIANTKQLRATAKECEATRPVTDLCAQVVVTGVVPVKTNDHRTSKERDRRRCEDLGASQEDAIAELIIPKRQYTFRMISHTRKGRRHFPFLVNAILIK
ncbi:unnamed protein product [Angiostrongylus costaricensis]|uniref:Secreted protein n=1 Tax=Angiostrongylus costaricensis TaxID=334426 RepID=A0A0R3PYV3_ANGCS|nr:unnamed protein product [Angiostrongylus costaricensis]